MPMTQPQQRRGGTDGDSRNALGSVPGLSYIEEIIPVEEEARLLEAIDEGHWSAVLKRRVQHHGYRYDYRARKVEREMYLGPLPAWAQEITRELERLQVMTQPPDQLIVNEYLPGQGIAPHIDCVPCFGATVAVLSLGSTCLMEFSQPRTGEHAALLLSPRSLLVLTDEARYRWRHAIRGRRSDVWQGARCPRSRRVSLTFRSVRLPSP
jgi:alkylated DNA repair dioxygenase AlkB